MHQLCEASRKCQEIVFLTQIAAGFKAVYLTKAVRGSCTAEAHWAVRCCFLMGCFNKEMKVCGCKSADAPLSFVPRELTLCGLQGGIGTTKCANTEPPLRGRSRAGWEWLMGQESDTLRGSASDPRPAPLLRRHRTQPAQWQRRRPHTTRFLSVIYPQCHGPFLPPEGFKNLCRGGEAKLLWLVPSFPLRCRHEGLFTHGSQLDPSQMNSLHRHTKGSFASALKGNLQRRSDFCLIPHQTAGMSAANCTTSFH